MNKLVKILLVIISVLAPMKGFCFPDIPENYWMENTIPGFWDEPQYTTGYNSLMPTTDPVTYGVSGNSMEHTIIISHLVDPHHKHALCQIWNKGGSMETTANIERYPYKYNNNYP